MKQGNTIVVALGMLAIGFVAGFALRPSIAPTYRQVTAATAAVPTDAEPRGTQYFAAHLDEGRQIVTSCADGSVRGQECANAGAAVSEAEGKERFRKFIAR
ncbi:MAG: hypothetical protein ABR588_12270 [Sphingomicrobium sp.]